MADTPRSGLSRRDMIKAAGIAGAAAWTAPVIIDSLTSPAAALSKNCLSLSWVRSCAVGSTNTSTWTLTMTNLDAANTVTAVTPTITFDGQCISGFGDTDVAFSKTGGTYTGTITSRTVTVPATASSTGSTAVTIAAGGTATVILSSAPDGTSSSRVNMTATATYTCHGGTAQTTASASGGALECGSGSTCN